MFSPQHVVGHHIYTNVFGADPDLPETAEGDPRRLVHRQKYASFYRYQHIYLPPLYGILGLKVGWGRQREVLLPTSDFTSVAAVAML